jgi:hypothetical protein
VHSSIENSDKFWYSEHILIVDMKIKQVGERKAKDGERKQFKNYQVHNKIIFQYIRISNKTTFINFRKIDMTTFL